MSEIPALAIGSKTWPGLGKLLEESGELQQVIGKLIAYPEGPHPDGTNAISRLHDEIGDVLAACQFVVQTNNLDAEHIMRRRARKLSRFVGWHSQQPAACGRVLVGQGTDTYDPLCIRPAGHPGVCQP
jgi:NTP pyrophosphatase (non-canonical NTP hydrolase)